MQVSLWISTNVSKSLSTAGIGLWIEFGNYYKRKTHERHRFFRAEKCYYLFFSRSHGKRWAIKWWTHASNKCGKPSQCSHQLQSDSWYIYRAWATVSFWFATARILKNDFPSSAVHCNVPPWPAEAGRGNCVMNGDRQSHRGKKHSQAILKK